MAAHDARMASVDRRDLRAAAPSLGSGPVSYVLFAMVAALWSASFILMKKAAPCFGPLTVGSLRLVGGVLVLVALMLVMRERWRPRGSQWGVIALLIAFGYAWPYVVQPYLVGLHGSGFIGMMVGFVPLLTVVASVPLLGVRPSPRQLAGVLGGLACLAAIFGDAALRAVPPAHLALAVSVPLGYAIANTLVKRCFADAPPAALTAWCLGIAAVLVSPAAMAAERVVVDERLPLALVSAALLGVAGTGLAGWWFYLLIRRRGPLFAGMVTYVIPVGALLIGWLDGEAVTTLQTAAMVGILVMVALVQIPARRPTDAPTT